MNQLNALQDFFSRLPEPPRREASFFEISGFPHHENVMSNVLAFFLDSRNGLDRLLLDAFLSFGKPPKHLDFARPTLIREARTPNGNRIDILVIENVGRLSGTRGVDCDSALIIENKIQAALDNDLDDYWAYPLAPDDKKLGIVLSLYPLLTLHPHFSNVTYAELTKALEENVGKYFAKAQPRALFLLRELLLHFKNLSGGHSMDPLISFFLQNKEHFLRAAQTIQSVQQHIEAQVDEFAARHGFSVGAARSNVYKYVYLDPEKTYSFTIVYGPLLTEVGGSISVLFEYFGESNDFLPKLRKDPELKSRFPDFNFDVSYLPSHVAFIECHPSAAELGSLADFLDRQYSEKFAPFAKEIIKRKHGA